MKHIVVLTGAGMSAESGLSTFRDSNGLWENYDVSKVASIEGWYENPELIRKFYNHLRSQLKEAQPNEGHKILAELEKKYKLSIITQNVDNLHERAGSTEVVHLHGELTKACSSRDKSHVTDIGYREIEEGEKSADGSPLRPFIVWFGEPVPMIEKASAITAQADIFVVVGTSLQVYPAAGLLYYVKSDTPLYLIDPKEVHCPMNVTFIKEGAGKGLRILRDKYL